MGQLKGLFKRTLLDDSTAEESTSPQETLVNEFEMSEEHSHIIETSHQEGAMDNQFNHENVQEESETNAFSTINISNTDVNSVVSQELTGVEKTAKEVQDETGVISTCNVQVIDSMEEKTDIEMIKLDENNTASVK